MPILFSRLLRPFSTSSLSLGPESGGAAQQNFPANAQKATVAAGCFWGVDHLYRKHFGNGKGLLDAKVGYCGGNTSSPSYRSICSGKTGRMLRISGFHFKSFQSSSIVLPVEHQFSSYKWRLLRVCVYLLICVRTPYTELFVHLLTDSVPLCWRGVRADAESLQVVFDPSIVSYRQLLEFFYRMHDPTTLNRQGMDVGTQYRSAIFTHNEEQQRIAESVTEQVGKEWWTASPLSTVVTPAGQWYEAEDYHQLYLQNNPGGYECPAQ